MTMQPFGGGIRSNSFADPETALLARECAQLYLRVQGSDHAARREVRRIVADDDARVGCADQRSWLRWRWQYSIGEWKARARKSREREARENAAACRAYALSLSRHMTDVWVETKDASR